MPAQPKKKPFANIDHPDVLTLLMDHIHNLEYRLPGGSVWLKLPYFQDRFTPNPNGTQEVKRRFCEAIVQLLEKHDQLK